MQTHLGARPYASVLTDVWEIFCRVAPFAFGVLDEINSYVDEAAEIGVSWQVALDEQMLQKVLTKVKGTDLAQVTHSRDSSSGMTGQFLSQPRESRNDAPPS